VSSPPCEEEGESDGLEDTGKSTNSDGVKRALLGEDLGDERRSRASHEDQRTKIRSTLVGESTGRINKGTDTI